MNKSNKLIDAISKIRVKNNKCWIEILKLAFKHAPKESAKLMKSITENDKKVSALSAKLGEIK